jgi:hypothetical protein
MEIYLADHPLIRSFGNNSTRLNKEREGKFPKRFYLQADRKPAYWKHEVDALVTEKAKQAEEARARNSIVGARLVVARQLKAAA